MRKRDIQIILHLDSDERDRFMEIVERSGLSRESYLRQLINGLVPTDAPPPDYHAMMKELRAIGASFDHIAHYAKTLNMVDAEWYGENADALNRAIVEITNAVKLPRVIERKIE